MRDAAATLLVSIIAFGLILDIAIITILCHQMHKRSKLSPKQKSLDKNWGVRIGLLWGAFLSSIFMPFLMLPLFIAWLVLSITKLDQTIYEPLPARQIEFPDELFNDYVEPPPIIK